MTKISRKFAFLLSLLMIIVNPNQCMAATNSVAGSISLLGTEACSSVSAFSENPDAENWIIPVSIWKDFEKSKQGAANMYNMEVDGKALVTKNQDGTYHIRLGYSGYHVFDIVQVVNPANNQSALDYVAESRGVNYGIAYLDWGNFNVKPKEEFHNTADYDSYIAPYISENANKLYFTTDDEIEITQADSKMDTGYIEFDIEDLSQDILINACYSYASKTYIKYSAFVLEFDESAMVSVPYTVTYEEGTYTMGLDWTNYINAAVTNCNARSTDISVKAYLENIFEKEVKVVVNESGELAAEFTLSENMEKTITSIDIGKERNTDPSEYTTIQKRALSRDIMGVSFDSIWDTESGQDTVTIAFRDMLDGKVMRISDSSLTSDNYYFGHLWLTKDVKDDSVEIKAMAENGVILTGNSNYLPGFDNFESSNLTMEDASIRVGVIETIKNFAETEDKYILYQYRILDSEGNIITPTGSFSVDFPIPDDFNLDTTLFYYQTEKNNNASYGAPSGISELVENQGKNYLRITPVNTADAYYNIVIYDQGTPMSAGDLADLEVGYYKVHPTIALTKSTGIASGPSMSAPVIQDGTGILEVVEKGEEYNLYVDLKAVYALSTYGYVYEWYTYQGDENNIKKLAESYSYKSGADLPENEWEMLQPEKDAANLMIDNFTTEYQLYYPQTIKMPLKNQKENDAFKIGVVVPIMNSVSDEGIKEGLKNADIRLIKGQCEPIGKDELPEYNKSLLRGVIYDVQWFLETVGGEDVTALKTALEDAETAYINMEDQPNENLLFDEINKLKSALVAAGGGQEAPLVADGAYEVSFNMYTVGTDDESARKVYFKSPARLTVQEDEMTVTFDMVDVEGDYATQLQYDNASVLKYATCEYDENGEVSSFTFTRPYTEDRFEIDLYTKSYNYQNTIDLELNLETAEALTASEEETQALKTLIAELQEVDNKLYTEASITALNEAIYNAKSIVETNDYLTYITVQKQIALLTEAKDNLVLVADLPGLLSDALARANTCKDNMDIYTEETMAVLIDAIDKGKTVYDNYTSATESEVETAIEELEAAIAGLISIRYLALNKLVGEVQNYQSTVYTEAIWTEFKKALDDAQAVLDAALPSEDDLRTSYEKLEQAVEALVQASKEELKELLNHQAELDKSDYTADSWAVYQLELEAAQNVYDEENSDKNDYDNAVVALKHAEENLELVQTESLKELKELIAELTEKLLEEDSYEETSFAAFSASLAASEDAVEFADTYKLTTEQIATQVDALQAEYDALILISDLQSGTSTAATAVRSFSRISYDAVDIETEENNVEEDDDVIPIENDLIVEEEEEEEATSAAEKETKAETESASEKETKTESTAAEKETATTDKETISETEADTKVDEGEKEKETEKETKESVKETEKETEAETKEKETEAAVQEIQAEIKARATISPFRISAVTSSVSTASSSNATAASSTSTARTSSSLSTYTTDIDDGIYCVNYALWQFSANKESMGNPALCDAYPEKSGKQAKIKVEDGEVYLYVELQVMEFGGDTGHLLEMFIMDNLVTDAAGEVIESYTELYPEVVEYTDETDGYGPPEGSKYPKLLKFNITKYMTAKNQYIPVMVNVPVMGASAEQPAYLRCYWNTFALVESTGEEDPDDPDDNKITLVTEALDAAITKASTAKKSEYTAASYEALTKSVLAAAAVKVDGLGASQDMVDNRTDALLKTYAALIPVSESSNNNDTSQSEEKIALLKLIIATYSSYSEGNYTTDSWETFSNARASAQLVYYNPDATNIEVILAQQTLETAIAGLKEVAVVDKTELASLISYAQSLTYSDYSESSWIQVASALNLARVIYRDSASTQTEVDAQAKELSDAIDNLQAATSNGSSGNSSSGTNSSGSSNSDEENGYYSIKVRLWHSSLNKASMGDDAVENKAYVMIKDGEATIRMVTKKMTVSGITAHLHDFWIYIDGGYQAANLISTENSRWIYEFDLPNTTSTYYKCELDPQVEVMGYDPVKARLKVDWDSLNDIDVDDWDSLAGDVDDDDDSSSNSAGTSVVSSYTTELIDKLTGVRVQGSTGGPSIKLSVTSLLEGEEFEHANSVLENLVNQFTLYNINLLDGEQKVQPTGAVTLKIPIPDGYDQERLVLYRFNDDGTVEQIYGQINGSFYEVSVSHFSCYALAESTQALAAANTGSSVSSSGSSGQTSGSKTGSASTRSTGTGAASGLSSTAAIQVAGGRIIPYTGDDTPVAAWMSFGLAAVALWLGLALTEKRGRRS